MALASLADRLRAGETILSSWHAIPEPLIVEAVARAGFDAVVLDMQHGQFGPESLMRSIAAAALAGKPAVARVAVGDFAMASRALDMGAAGVIAPMINSAAEASALVAAMKYPPLGARSWGPARAMALAGERDEPAFLAAGNAASLAIAMIETRAALEEVDSIIATPGIDGVFVGPWDLSVSLSGGKTVDPLLAGVDEALRQVARAAGAAGKVAATMVPNPERARAAIDIGYRFIAVATDSDCLVAGARGILAGCRL